MTTPASPAAHRRARLLHGGLLAVLLLAGCDGHDPDASVAVAAPGALPPAKSARFVKLEEVTEWNGHPWASVAEFNLLDATGATLDRKGWVASADSSIPSNLPAYAIDGDAKSFWHTPWEGDAPPPPPHALVIDLGATLHLSGFRYLARQDGIVNGTIARYRFYVSSDGVDWGQPVAAGNFVDMSAPRTEKTVIFAAQTENRPPVAETPSAQTTPMGIPVALKIVAKDPDGDPLTFSAKNLPAGLMLDAKSGVVSGTPISPGESAVKVEVADNKGASATVAFDWTVQPPAAGSGSDSGGADAVRFVKLEELSEIDGKPWGSIAELNLIGANGANLPHAGWKAIADSTEGSDAAGNAIDGNPQTVWHSQWSSVAPPPPHSFIVDMGRPAVVRGFRYLPRQDGPRNGTIAKFRFYVSKNGADWGPPAAEGDFSTMGEPKAEKSVVLK